MPETPPENQPGHHPEVEQDRPAAVPDAYRLPPRRFGFRFEPWLAPFAAAVGVVPPTAHVDVDANDVRIRFGPWSLRTERGNVEAAEVVEGPFRPWKVAGPPHLSFSDRGVTFATDRRRAVCIRFREPVAGIEPTGRLRHPAAVVTVAEPEDLVAALQDE